MMAAQNRKDEWLPLIANYVAQHGLGGASLRPLAKAIGTSDRMLIYHFGSKDELMTELLGFVSAQVMAMLDAAAQGSRAESRHACLVMLGTLMRNPMLRPFLRTWGEMLVEAEGGNALYRDSAQAIVARLDRWIRDHLPEDDPDPDAAAAQILALVEGIGVLDMAGCSDIADRVLAAPLA